MRVRPARLAAILLIAGLEGATASAQEGERALPKDVLGALGMGIDAARQAGNGPTLLRRVPAPPPPRQPSTGEEPRAATPTTSATEREEDGTDGADIPLIEKMRLRNSLSRALDPTPAQRVITGQDETFVLGPKDPRARELYEQGRYQFPLLPSVNMGPLGLGVGPSVKQPTVRFRYRLKPRAVKGDLKE